MFKFIKYFFICILISCYQNEKTEINTSDNASTKQLPKTISIYPLFLGLSPHMSELQYENHIRKLNEKGSLEGYIFPLTINNNYSEFLISKTSNSIKLSKEESENFTPYDITKDKSRNLMVKYNNRKNEILNLYTNKYKKSKIQLPVNFDLSKFNLDKERYILFEDKDKYILFGYSMKGDIYPSLEEREQEDRESGNDKIFGYKTFTGNQSNVRYIFGYDIQVDYYEKDDLDKILEIVNFQSKKKIEKLKGSKEIEASKEKNKTKNISEI